MARKKQSTLPTSAGSSSSTAAATPLPLPDLMPDVEVIMNWWRNNAANFSPAIKKAAMWQPAFDNFKLFFGISPSLKKAEPGIVLNNPASQSGTGMAKKVMILPPLDITSPSVSPMATEEGWEKVLETQQTPIALFLETDTSDPTNPKDVVHTILVDENHGLYDSTTMSEIALASVFPSFPFVYKAIPKRATTKTTIPALWPIEEFKNIILEGVPGTGKTHAFGELVKEWPKVFSRSAHKRVMTFHPSTSYEDFIVGIRPTAPVSGGSPFAVKPGFIVDVVVEACRNPTEDYLILLDEFNRANVPKVMGDLLTLLEASKRATFDASTAMWKTETTVTLPLKFPSPPPSPTSSVGVSASSVPPSPGGLLLSEATWDQFFIPDNVYVIGTMNTTDRSVAPLDSALRRRFVFFRIEPLHYKDLETILCTKFGVSKPLIREHTSLWGGLNQWLAKNIGLDAKLGHSYLFEASRVLNKSTRAKSSIALWEILLLPQLQDILMNNHLDADQMADFNTEIATFSLEKKKLVLSTTGTGINEMPLLAFE